MPPITNNRCSLCLHAKVPCEEEPCVSCVASGVHGLTMDFFLLKHDHDRKPCPDCAAHMARADALAIRLSEVPEDAATVKVIGDLLEAGDHETAAFVERQATAIRELQARVAEYDREAILLNDIIDDMQRANAGMRQACDDAATETAEADRKGRGFGELAAARATIASQEETIREQASQIRQSRAA